MKVVHLLHNPSAGDKAHTMDILVSHLTDNGYDCRYASVKEKGWEKVGDDVDIVAIAGGDGTVRRAVKMLLGRKLLQKTFPLALIPMGTANNISKSLGAPLDRDKAVGCWANAITQPHDIGVLTNVPEEKFFMEGFGYGVFPELMTQMKKRGKEKIETPEEKMKETFRLLHELIIGQEATPCQLVIDGKDYSGEYLLVEVMNTKAIGPNLTLSEHAQPDDSVFEVVMATEAHRQQLADYVVGKMYGKEAPPALHIVKGSNITIKWEGILLHADDKLIKMKKPVKVGIQLREKLISFILPERPTPGLTE